MQAFLIPVRRFSSPSRSIHFGGVSEAKLGPRDPKRFGRSEQGGLGTTQDAGYVHKELEEFSTG